MVRTLLFKMIVSNAKINVYFIIIKGAEKTMAWNYAELSKMAKDSGGPEKLVELLVKSGEKKMLPWVGAAFAGGITLTVGVQKTMDYLVQKKAISTAEVESAKKELIQGIKKYDATKAATENEVLKESDGETDEAIEAN
jgi:hypothetical protein